MKYFCLKDLFETFAHPFRRDLMKKTDCCLVRKSFKILPVPSGILHHWFYPILPHEIYQFLGDVEIWQSFQRIHIWNSWLISPILAIKCTSNELPWCVVVFSLIRDNLGSIFHHEIHPFLIENLSKPWRNSNFWPRDDFFYAQIWTHRRFFSRFWMLKSTTRPPGSFWVHFLNHFVL